MKNSRLLSSLPSDRVAIEGPFRVRQILVSKWLRLSGRHPAPRVSCSVILFRVLSLTVAKRPVLFADFNHTNEHVLAAQAQTLVEAVCDCFVKATFLIHGSPSVERDLDKHAIFRSLNAQVGGIKDEILRWMLRDDLEAIIL